MTHYFPWLPSQAKGSTVTTGIHLDALVGVCLSLFHLSSQNSCSTATSLAILGRIECYCMVCTCVTADSTTTTRPQAVSCLDKWLWLANVAENLCSARPSFYNRKNRDDDIDAVDQSQWLHVSFRDCFGFWPAPSQLRLPIFTAPTSTSTASPTIAAPPSPSPPPEHPSISLSFCPSCRAGGLGYVSTYLLLLIECTSPAARIAANPSPLRPPPATAIYSQQDRFETDKTCTSTSNPPASPQVLTLYFLSKKRPWQSAIPVPTQVPFPSCPLLLPSHLNKHSLTPTPASRQPLRCVAARLTNQRIRAHPHCDPSH